jgi:hypothetical protein
VKARLRSRGAIVQTELLLIANRAYLRNPFEPRYEELGATPRVALLDPDDGVARAMTQVAAPALVRVDTEEGTRVFRLRGRLPTGAVARMIGGTPVGETVAVEAGIREGDWLLTRFVMSGNALVGDDANAVRTIALSRWGAPVDIAIPR